MVKPILFSADMVKAILEERKTVTRRLVKPQPLPVVNTLYRKDDTNIWRTCGADWWYEFRAPCVPGDILWVREAWGMASDLLGGVPGPAYRTDYTDNELRALREKHYHWYPSIHMPKEAARIFLQVKEVRAGRLQDCGNAQAKDEGCTCCSQFVRVWNSAIKPADRAIYGWEANPWVWIIQFERCEKPEGWPG